MQGSTLAPPKRSKELENAVYDDWKRKAIDSAKKRAVAQFVDYETFKNMVSVAHLKPLGEKTDRQGTVQMPSWSMGREGKPIRQAAGDTMQLSSTQLPKTLPKTSSDFTRCWRRCASAEHRYVLLRQVGATGIKNLFTVEIASTLLSEMVTTVAQCWSAHACLQDGCGDVSQTDAPTEHLDRVETGAETCKQDDINVSGAGTSNMNSVLGEAAWVVDLLEALSKSGRFSLVVRLLPAKAKQALKSVLVEVRDVLSSEHCAVQQSGKVERVATLYNVTLA